MLVLTRKSGQKLVLGEEIVVTVLEVSGDRVKLGIEAPRSVRVLRPEAAAQLSEANRAAAGAKSHLRLLWGGRASEPPSETA